MWIIKPYYIIRCLDGNVLTSNKLLPTVNGLATLDQSNEDYHNQWNER